MLSSFRPSAPSHSTMRPDLYRTLPQNWCIEAVKAKAREIMELAPRVHADAITRLVGGGLPAWGVEACQPGAACSVTWPAALPSATLATLKTASWCPVCCRPLLHRRRLWATATTAMAPRASWCTILLGPRS